MYRIPLLCLLVALLGASATAQDRPDPAVPQGENLKIPEGWEFRLDRPDESVHLVDDPEATGIYFVNMTPGWHLTTGPRGIFYHPANVVEGDYSIHTKLHYFNPNGRNREGYGLFFGGRNLQSNEIEYVYFLVRNTGDFLVKSRKGEEYAVIIDWTPSDAINLYDNEEVSSVLNTLAVEVTPDSTNFYINGKKVATTERLNADGVFGLRVNHMVNLHVEDLGTGLE